MAKHKNRGRETTRPPSFPSFDIYLQSSLRGDLYTANEPSYGVFEPVSRSLPEFTQDFDYAVRSTLQDVEDRRTYHPAGRNFRPASSLRRHQIKTIPTQFTEFSTNVFQSFKTPRSVNICVRRHQRKEVLHALGQTGKGSRFHKKARRNYYSTIRC